MAAPMGRQSSSTSKTSEWFSAVNPRSWCGGVVHGGVGRGGNMLAVFVVVIVAVVAAMVVVVDGGGGGGGDGSGGGGGQKRGIVPPR